MSTTATAKVDSTTTKKPKAPAASAGGAVTNLGPAFDPFSSGGDPFAEERAAGTPSIEAQVGKDDKIHIRLQQRNGRKTVTTVQGIPTKYDPRKLIKVMKKEFGCIGHVANSVDSDEEESAAPPKGNSAASFGQIIQFSGDQRTKTRDFLISSGIVKAKDAKNIVVHGY